MKTVTKIDQIESMLIRKTRVAAYCRVSTDNIDQLLSLDTQKQHYENYIKSNPEWEYAGLYYDEGVSGTKKDKRDGLKALINDCEKGLIDLVLTKSISRFSRNTTDCLELVRKLLKYDVYIQFEKENIHTGSMESELMLAILASMAKDESVSISENAKWGIKRRFMNGTFIIGYPPYGYANFEGEMIIIPEQAEVVRKIFMDTLDGKSTHSIAQELNQVGVPTKKGGKWTAGTISGIISNEKYTGDVLFQKTFTDDNFNRHTNKGDCDQFFCENHHEAIISHETFEKANEVLKQRGLEKGNNGDTTRYQNRYGFSGKIKCGECGGTFKRRIITILGGYYIAWCCGKHIEDKNSCSMKDIRDEDLKRAFLTMMNKLRFGNDLVLKPLLVSICTSNAKKNEFDIEKIEKAMLDNEEQRKQMNSLLTKGYLELSVFYDAHNKLVTEYEELVSKRDMILRMNESGYTIESSIKELVEFLGKSDIMTEFDDDIFKRFIEKIIMKSREEIVFEFKFGLKLTERLG